MHKIHWIIVLGIMLLPTLALAVPASIVDDMTGTRFLEQPTLSGTTFQCMGVGWRKAFTFKIYSVAFCLDQSSANDVVREALAAHADQSGDALVNSLKNDDAFFEALMRAPGEKMVVIRFARDIDQKMLEGAFRRATRKYLSSYDVERVVAPINFSVRDGDVAILRSQGDAFVVQYGKQKQVVPDAATINQRLWRICLGRDTDTPTLKESIAARAAAATKLVMRELGNGRSFTATE